MFKHLYLELRSASSLLQISVTLGLKKERTRETEAKRPQGLVGQEIYE